MKAPIEQEHEHRPARYSKMAEGYSSKRTEWNVDRSWVELYIRIFKV